MSDLYRITVGGYLDPRWSSSLGDLTISQTETGETILSGPLADQAALHGVLNQLCDLNVSLISLTRVHVTPPGDAAKDAVQGEDGSSS